MAKNSKRRIDKKLYRGNFTVRGFHLQFELTTIDLHGATEELFEYFDANNLVVGGGIGPLTELFVRKTGRYESATQTDVDNIFNWLNKKAYIQNVVYSSLLDVHR